VQAFGYGQTDELLEAPGVIDQRQEDCYLVFIAVLERAAVTCYTAALRRRSHRRS